MFLKNLPTGFVGGFLLAAAGCASMPEQESVVGDYLSGRFAARTNEVGAAASAYEGARADVEGDSTLLRNAFLYQLAAGEVEEAASIAGKILENDEAADDDLARIVLAARAIRNEDYPAAHEALAVNPQAAYLGAPMTILNAWALAGEQGPEAGLKVLAQRDAEIFRGFHPLHQALLFEKAGLLSEAGTAYQLSLATYGGLVGFNAYGAFLEREDTEKARAFYEQGLANTGVVNIMAQQGMARLEKGRVSYAFSDMTPAKGASIALHLFAQAILEQIEEQRKAAEDAGFNIGDPNYDMPLALIQTSLYLNPDYDHAQWLAGRVLNAYGDSARAIDGFKRIRSESPFYEQARIDIAIGLIGLKRHDEALKILRVAARNPNADAEVRFQYANLLVERGKHEDALDVFGALIDSLPQQPPVSAWRYHIARAALYLKREEWPEAEQDLLRAVEIAPEQPVALNYLGYSWAERGVNLEKAFNLIEQAVAKEPNSGAYIDSLGWAYYQQGDYDAAVGHLEHAASLEPADPTITDHLGDVYWRLGRKIEAKYQWRHVLELEPGEKLEKSVERKLEEGLPELSQ